MTEKVFFYVWLLCAHNVKIPFFGSGGTSENGYLVTLGQALRWRNLTMHMLTWADLRILDFTSFYVVKYENTQILHFSVASTGTHHIKKEVRVVRVTPSMTTDFDILGFTIGNINRRPYLKKLTFQKLNIKTRNDSVSYQ